ncbi:hypothetical protein BDY24DRAFT_377553 [Mrakia frigida]|uniref:uncharacterized protein n=1 Tax=Mrakia frigida TaxID=29902 RepID=UPI003FCC00E3
MFSSRRNLFFLALPFLAWLCMVEGAAYNKVALKSIKTLTFSSDKMTTARRSSPIPQLSCIGPACSRYSHYVTVVQCSNMGDDGSGSVQWKCQSDLPSSLRLGKVEVSCEGWSKPGDSNVLQVRRAFRFPLFSVPLLTNASLPDSSQPLSGILWTRIQPHQRSFRRRRLRRSPWTSNGLLLSSLPTPLVLRPSLHPLPSLLLLLLSEPSTRLSLCWT